MSDEEFEEVNILRKDKPDLVFAGRLVAEIDSKPEAEANARKTGDRWTDLAVYELPSGDWVAVTIACSDKAGETDFGEAVVIRRASNGIVVEAVDQPDTPAPKDLRPVTDEADAEALSRRAAMEFWRWTWLAKKLADRAGWDVRDRIQ